MAGDRRIQAAGAAVCGVVLLLLLLSTPQSLPTTSSLAVASKEGTVEIRLAVLVSFHAKTQADRAEARMAETWRLFPPCLMRLQDSTVRGLVLHVETAAAAAIARDMLTRLQNHAHLRDCFSSWHVTHANLAPEDDAWPVGPTRQFYAAMSEARKLDYDYVLQLEPDVTPVRSGWLDQAAALAVAYEQILPLEGLWMLGSLPQTAAVPVDKRLAQRLHINGNALYHIGSTAFAAFLELVRTNTASPAPWQEQAHSRAYDVDIATYLMQSEHYRFTQQHLHRFVLNPFIVNYWRRKADVNRQSPGTFLVHGGDQTDIPAVVVP